MRVSWSVGKFVSTCRIEAKQSSRLSVLFLCLPSKNYYNGDEDGILKHPLDTTKNRTMAGTGEPSGTTLQLPYFPPFDVDTEPTSLGTRWKKWLRRFDNFLVALDVSDTRQRAMLLHFAGERVDNIFDTLPQTQTPAKHIRTPAMLYPLISIPSKIRILKYGLSGI